MGAASASGSLIFGIGTQANNATGNVTVLGTDPNTGFITTVLNNQTYAASYIDSGSNLLSFASSVLPACPRRIQISTARRRRRASPRRCAARTARRPT
jgi:hypothetical protein